MPSSRAGLCSGTLSYQSNSVWLWKGKIMPVWGLLHRWQELITFSLQLNCRQYKGFGCNHSLNLQNLQPKPWIFRHCTTPASGLCSTDWRKPLGDKKDLLFYFTLQKAEKRCFFWSSPFYFFSPPNVSVQDVQPLGKGLQRVRWNDWWKMSGQDLLSPEAVATEGAQ